MKINAPSILALSLLAAAALFHAHGQNSPAAPAKSAATPAAPPVTLPTPPPPASAPQNLTRPGRGAALPAQFPKPAESSPAAPAATTTAPSTLPPASSLPPTVSTPAGQTTPAQTTARPTFPSLPTLQPTTRPATQPPAFGATTPGATAPGATTPGGASTNQVVITELSVTNAADGTVIKLQRFRNMPLDQFLELYARVSKKTILRPQNLPQVQVSFEPVSPLSETETLQAYDTVLALNQITMIPTGDKFVTAVPQAQAMQEGAAFSAKGAKDLPEASQFVTHIRQLKHVKPSEIAQLLQQFGKNPNGIVAIDPTMTLVLRDYAINVKRMLEVLDKVDITVEEDYTLEVIPIRYGKVEEIYGTMSGLIGGGGGGGGFVPNLGAGANSATGFGGGSRGSSRRTGSMGSRSGYDYSGSSGAYGGGTSGGRFGSGSSRYQAQQTGINPATSTGIGGTGTSFSGRMNQANRLAGGPGGQGSFGVPQLIEDAQIIPDLRSNSLIVYANKKDHEQIKKVVEKVDTLLAQVLIEAIIMEVSLNDSLNYGVSAGQRPKSLGGDVRGGGAVNNPSGQASSVGQFLSGSGVGTNAAVFPATGGMTYLTQIGKTWDVAVSALAADGKVNIIQRPRIQTSHAVPGAFFVGQTVPFIGGSYGGFGIGGVSSTYVQRENVGVELSVTPFITPDNLVVMEVEQTIASLGANVDIGGGASVPITNERTANATLSVRNGDSVLLGGYILGNEERGKTGVPVLKDIPVLGNIFSSNRRKRDRTEMMVLMRPTILPSPSDAARVAQTQRESMPGIRSAEREWKEDERRLNEAEDKASRKNWFGRSKKQSGKSNDSSLDSQPPSTQPPQGNPLP